MSPWSPNVVPKHGPRLAAPSQTQGPSLLTACPSLHGPHPPLLPAHPSFCHGPDPSLPLPAVPGLTPCGSRTWLSLLFPSLCPTEFEGAPAEAARANLDITLQPVCDMVTGKWMNQKLIENSHIWGLLLLQTTSQGQRHLQEMFPQGSVSTVSISPTWRMTKAIKLLQVPPPSSPPGPSTHWV